MISTSLHQYTPAFSHVPAPNMVDQHQHLAAQHMGPSPLDTLAHTSQYAALQFHHNRHVLPSGKGIVKPGRLPYANGPIAAAPRDQRHAMLHERAGRGAAASGPVRRRISRACDQCNQLRTKCDGKAPCAHCLEFGLTCEYVRERKKRGKASRKDLAAAAAAAAASGSAAPSGDSTSGSPQSRSHGFADDQKLAAAEAQPPTEQHLEQRSLPDIPPPSVPPPGRSTSMATTRGMDPPVYQNVAPMSRTMSLGAIDTIPEAHHMAVNNDGLAPMQPPRLQTQGLQMHTPIPEYASLDDFHRNMMHQSPHHMMQNNMHPIIPSNGMPEYSDSPYSMMSPQSAQAPNSFRMPTADSPMPAFMGHSPVSGSPSWLSLPSPSATMYQSAQPNAPQHLRYPVLQPLLPHLATIMPLSLACELLELYFQSSSAAFMQPVSPYILGYVFRKNSFLRQNNPRVCSPALLASMLWIGCLTSESPYLASSPSARSQLSEKLINLTISLLKPLVHASPGEDVGPTFGNPVVGGVTLTNFGMPAQESEIGLPGAPGGLDDVATYMHLAIVISASEYKAASLRWWHAAWGLARELKLGKEVPITPPPEHNDDTDAAGEVDIDDLSGTGQPSAQNDPVDLSEEQREERRRIWWLLFAVDRHLALCYNRPLSLLDIECDGLLQPVDDSLWQAGEFLQWGLRSIVFRSYPRLYSNPRAPLRVHRTWTFQLVSTSDDDPREIVELNHARNHPRFGRLRLGGDWDKHAAEIGRQLDHYGETLQKLHSRALNEASTESHELTRPGTPSARSVNSTASRAQESLMRARIVVAYGTHVMHTLHILLNGNGTPSRYWTITIYGFRHNRFIDATGHAVSAAEALNEILDHDPDLSFMPFFFGIYLLQGSFLLLLIADKLQGEASPNVVKACETIVRAHEACIVTLTLNTRYVGFLDSASVPSPPAHPLRSLVAIRDVQAEAWHCARYAALTKGMTGSDHPRIDLSNTITSTEIEKIMLTKHLQRNFRKVMRSALQQVRGRGMDEHAEYAQQRRREMLSLYRWSGDGSGLAL